MDDTLRFTWLYMNEMYLYFRWLNFNGLSKYSALLQVPYDGSVHSRDIPHRMTLNDSDVHSSLGESYDEVMGN